MRRFQGRLRLKILTSLCIQFFFNFDFLGLQPDRPPIPLRPLPVLWMRVLIEICPVVLAQTDIDDKINKKFSISFYTHL